MAISGCELFGYDVCAAHPSNGCRWPTKSGMGAIHSVVPAIDTRMALATYNGVNCPKCGVKYEAKSAEIITPSP